MDENSILLRMPEIAAWHLKSREEVDEKDCWAEMPSFQRGLVWSPAQIEVLWDSLMRGIPIGAISLLPINGTERFHKGIGGKDLKGAYWLVDGQQRSSAIALGFDTFPTINKPILWVDLWPDRSKRTRRKFFFYVTTPGRPWGYGISNGNDEKACEKVPVDQYRRVLREELQWTTLGAKPETFKMWPVKARLPVPFCELRRMCFASVNNIDLHTFTEEGAEAWRGHFKRVLDKHAGDALFNDCVENEISLVLDGIKKVENTRTIGLVAQGGFSGDENEVGETDENSNIAVYFARLNQGGTPPQKEDLDYSILKSIVPELSVLDQYAKGVMHPSRMANIAMLAYLSKDKWKASFSRSEIYRLQNDVAFREFIIPDRIDKPSVFKQAMDTVSQWLLCQSDRDFGLPKVVCSSITKSSPSLYRFLILMAMKVNSEGWSIDRKGIISFVTLVSWFGYEDKLNYADAYAEMFNCKSPDSLVRLLQTWVAKQIRIAAMVVPPRLNDLKKITNAAHNGDPKEIESIRNPVGYSEGLNIIWNWKSVRGREFLLYVCREYLAKTFVDYDPASAVWNEDSRPWDYDHIFPQDWLQRGRGNKRGDYHTVVEEFMMSIGNIAPVPFSLNRSWQKDPPRKYLESDNALVYVDFCDPTITAPVFVNERPQILLENDKKLACEFAYVIGCRWVRLYEKWLLDLGIESFLAGVDDSGRKKCLEKIAEKKFRLDRKIKLRTVYHWIDGRQYDVTESIDLTRPWVSCGVCGHYKKDAARVGRCMACITFNPSNTIDVGLRKHPKETGFNGTDSHWVNGYPQNFSMDDIDNALGLLDEIINNSDSFEITEKDDFGQ